MTSAQYEADPPCMQCGDGENRIDGFCSESCKEAAEAYESGFDDGRIAERHEIARSARHLAESASLGSAAGELRAFAQRLAEGAGT